MLNKDKDYHSYSSILRFIQEGPSSLITEKEKKTKGLSKGKMLDDYVYNNFEEIYYISDNSTKLTSMESDLLNLIYKELDGSINNDEFFNVCFDICKENKLFVSDISNKNKIQERVSKVKDIMLDNIKAEGKIKITSQNYIDITNMSNKLKENIYVKKYFNYKSSGDFQNLNQILIKFEYENIKYKSYLDNIHIDHKNKTIQEIDLKYTSFLMKDFKKSYYNYRYDIQACIYTLALHHYVENNLSLKDYRILEPCIVAVNTFEEPLLFKITSETIYSAYTGSITMYNNPILGIHEIVNKIKYHIENKKFIYDYEYYINGYQKLENINNNGNTFGFVKTFRNHLENNDELILEEVPLPQHNSFSNNTYDNTNFRKKKNEFNINDLNEQKKEIGLSFNSKVQSNFSNERKSLITDENLLEILNLNKDKYKYKKNNK